MDGIVTREISAANTEGGALAGRDNLWMLAAYVWFLGPGFTLFHLAGEHPHPTCGR
jgi:hypothetical protein